MCATQLVLPTKTFGDSFCCWNIVEERSVLAAVLHLTFSLHMQHSKEWWLGACLSTVIPVIYALTGGMRASLITDVAQSVACVGFLVAMLIVLGINAPANFGSWNPAGTPPPV